MGAGAYWTDAGGEGGTGVRTRGIAAGCSRRYPAMNASAAAPRPNTPTMVHVTRPSTGIMYPTLITAKPITNDPTDCSGRSGDSWRMTLRPIHRATPTFPRIHAANSAQITNGMTATPTIETASRKHTGPVSRSTSRPAANAVSGLAAKVSATAPTDRLKIRFNPR